MPKLPQLNEPRPASYEEERFLLAWRRLSNGLELTRNAAGELYHSETGTRILFSNASQEGTITIPVETVRTIPNAACHLVRLELAAKSPSVASSSKRKGAK